MTATPFTVSAFTREARRLERPRPLPVHVPDVEHPDYCVTYE